MASQLDRSGIVIPCPQCGRANRLAYATLGKAARCGQCRTALGPPGAPIEVEDAAAFDAAVRESALPILVDFWAPWCGPCRMVAPELARVAAAQAGRYLVLKINTDVQQELGERFRIRSIPTLALFAGGVEVERVAGALPAPEIEAFAARVSAGGRRAS